MKGFLFLCLIFILLLPSPTQVFGHSGRTDSYGGHNKTSNGTYHCHSGPCLDDAWKQAYNKFYPIGQKDGKTGNNQLSAISEKLNNELDPDVAEYMVPYAKKAYKMGYNETYWPIFWEKYGWFIGGAAVILSLGIFGFFRRQKKMNSWFTDETFTADAQQSKGKRNMVITLSSIVVLCIAFGILKYQSVFNEREELKQQISTFEKTNEQASKNDTADPEQEPTQETTEDPSQQPVQETVQEAAPEPIQETTQGPVSETTKYTENADPSFIAFYKDTKQEYENLIIEFNQAEKNEFKETDNLIASAEKLKVIVNKDILNGQYEFARQAMVEDLNKLIADLNANSPQYEIIQNVQDIQLNYRDILSVTLDQ